MRESYQRSSSSGVMLTELDHLSVLQEDDDSEDPPSPLLPGNGTTLQPVKTTAVNGPPTIAVPPPSLDYTAIRDLLCSLAFFLLGWWGPKYMKPSEEYLQEREIPHQVLSTGDVVLDLTLDNPVVDPPTVPTSSLIFGSIWVPILVMSVVGLLKPQQQQQKRSLHEVALGFSSLLLAVGGSEGSTQLLKHWVLRRRPNFYQLCQFNTSTRHCEAEYDKVLEAQQSFPSGHSSLSWCGMVVLACFLLRRKPMRGRKLYRLVCVVLPFSYAAFVASSRIVDHWHHASDVLTGVFLGSLWGLIGFLVHHYRPKDDDSNGSSVLPSTTALPSPCLTGSAPNFPSLLAASAPKLPSSHE